MWGILPIGSSILAIILLVLFPERKRLAEPLVFPSSEDERVYLREAN